MRRVVLLVLLAACRETASPPPAAVFTVGVRSEITGCSFEIYSPVAFTVDLAIGEESRVALPHAEGRFPLGWRATAGATALSSGIHDSTSVPGGFTFIC